MDDLTVVLVFISLFLLQTAVYTYLLLRLRRRLLKAKPIQAIVSPKLLLSASRDVTELKRVPDSVIQALRVLREAPLSAREVSLRLRLSREHTARLLKRMVEEGLVERSGKPYRYSLTELGARLLDAREGYSSEETK